MRRLMATKSNRVVAQRILDMIKDTQHLSSTSSGGGLSFLDEPNVHAAHVEFMCRLLRLVFKEFRTRTEMTCTYSLRDVIVCARARRDYGRLKTHETHDQIEIIRKIDLKCMEQAKLVEKAILSVMVDLANGSAWVDVRDAFNEKFIVHGKKIIIPVCVCVCVCVCVYSDCSEWQGTCSAP